MSGEGGTVAGCDCVGFCGYLAVPVALRVCQFLVGECEDCDKQKGG